MSPGVSYGREIRGMVRTNTTVLQHTSDAQEIGSIHATINFNQPTGLVRLQSSLWSCGRTHPPQANPEKAPTHESPTGVDTNFYQHLLKHSTVDIADE